MKYKSKSDLQLVSMRAMLLEKIQLKILLNCLKLPRVANTASLRLCLFLGWKHSHENVDSCVKSSLKLTYEHLKLGGHTREHP